MPKDFSAVAKESGDYLKMKEYWDICDSLWGGTKAMREGNKLFLPKYAAESEKDYESRLSQTVLFNMFKKAVKTLVGKAFKSPVVLQEDVSSDLVEWATNIDREGRSINTFAIDLMSDAIRRGVSHFMVDAPPSSAKTKADQRQNGERPYWVHMPATEIIGWQEVVEGGQRKLSQLRRKHCVSIPDGEFGVRTVDRITVYDRGNYRTFEQRAKGSGKGETSIWEIAQDEDGNDIEGSTGIDYIPLVTLYTGRTGFMTAEPPLIDLSYKNIEHWQSSSDQRHILKWARFAVLCLFGFDTSGDFAFGPDTPLVSENVDARVEFAEHSGAAIESGFKDLEQLKEEMSYMALEPMLRQPGNVTATARALDEGTSNSQLEAWMDGLKVSIETGLKYSADRSGGGEGGTVKVNEDFALPANGTDATTIIEAVQNGLLSKKLGIQVLGRLVPALGDAIEHMSIDDIMAEITSEARSNPAFDNLRQRLDIGE